MDELSGLLFSAALFLCALSELFLAQRVGRLAKRMGKDASFEKERAGKTRKRMSRLAQLRENWYAGRTAKEMRRNGSDMEKE